MISKPAKEQTDNSQQTLSKLSDDIGRMADRIGDMADRIGDMAERILETQRIQSENLRQTQTASLEIMKAMADLMRSNNSLLIELAAKGKRT